MKKVKKEEQGWKKISDFLPLLDPEKGIVEGRLLNVQSRGKEGSLIYTIETPKGQFCFWGSAQLDQKLGQVAVGNEIKIEFKGRVKTSSGRKVKTFDVYWK